MKIFILLLLAPSLLLFSCKKEESGTPNPPISEIPFIELKSVSPQLIHQLDDSLVFTIRYTDGNGDLGDYSADTLSLLITDNRFPLTEKFHIPPLAPQGTSITITGDLLVTLDHIILADHLSAEERATFTIQLKDRAGNWSNEVTSDEITVLP
jgi:hypothetical protein